MSIKHPAFTEEEKDQIITDLMALKKEQIGDFLSRSGLPKSGTRKVIKKNIENGLDDETIDLSQIVKFLDEIVPWGKQHVFLYKGPTTSISDWKDTDWLRTLLKSKRMGKYLNNSLPLILPEEMKVSSIEHDKSRLRIIAIKRREGYERKEEYDQTSETPEGEAIELRAYLHRVTRSLVVFEWNLVDNTASLQISQLPSGSKYEEVAEEFFNLVSDWLNISLFSMLDLQPVIKNLHRLEEEGSQETRSHGINYRTLGGRKVDGKSPSSDDSLLGEAVIDEAFRAIREKGVGHLGNFYWLPRSKNKSTNNPIEKDLHVIILGSLNRINLPTPNMEQTVRYVLSRIRNHSAEIPESAPRR